MSITRWDPFREVLSLREAMDRLLEQSVVPTAATDSRAAQGGAMTLALDVADRDDAYEVAASLPGVRPEDIQVTVLGDTLTIRAETGGEQERREGNYLLRERRRGVLQRTIVLPMPIESDAVQADYENGVLRLRLPKSQASRPRQIDVHGSNDRTAQQSTGQITGQSDGERQQAMGHGEGQSAQPTTRAEGRTQERQPQPAGQAAAQAPAEQAQSAGQSQAERR